MSETTLRAFLLIVYVIGLDVRHDCSSVPCLAHVIGLDVGNDFTSVSAGSLRDGARFQEWRCAHFVHIVVFLNDSLSVQIINKKNVWNQLGS